MQRKNKNNRRAEIGVAMAILGLAVTTVSGALYANRVYAKETLQGIKKVVESVTEKDSDGKYTNPFVILEIIPDFVERKFTGLTDSYGNDIGEVTFGINVGSAGYYVKGQEPTTQNLQTAFELKAEDESYIFNDSEARKGIAAVILDPESNGDDRYPPLRGLGFLINNSDNAAVMYNDSPAGYKELRLGESMEAEVPGSSTIGMKYSHDCDGDGRKEEYAEATKSLMKKLVKDQTFIELPRDYEGVDGEAYVDTATGIMTKIPQDADKRGNFTLTYVPKLTEGGELDTAKDEAYKFLVNGETGVFAGSSDHQGEFDPYFVTPELGGEKVRAVFSYAENAPNGYKVLRSDPAEGAVLKGTPLYLYDMEDRVYKFAGYAGTDITPTGAGSEPDGSEEPSGSQEEGSEPEKDKDKADEPGEPDKPDGTEGSGSSGEPDEKDKSDEPAGAGDPGKTDGTEDTTEPTGQADPLPGTGKTSGMTGFAKPVLGEYRINAANEPVGDPESGTENAAEEIAEEPATIPAEGAAGEPADGAEPKPADEKNTEPADGSEDKAAEEPSGDTDPAADPEDASKADPTAEKKESEDGKKNESAEPSKDGENEAETEKPEDTAYIFDAGSGVTYYILHFGYVADNAGSEALYQVFDYDVDAEYCEYAVNAGVEGAIVPNAFGTGLIKIADSSKLLDQLIYDYTPEQGAYSWTGEVWLSEEDKGKAGVYRIRGAQIYYSTGLLNRDFFKKYVFDREDDECDDLPIVVKTIPASLVKPSDVNKSSMLILQRGEPVYGCADVLIMEPEFSYPVYSTGEGGCDISDSVYAAIKEKVKTGYPVVSDFGMFKEGESSTNVYKLTRELILNEYGYPVLDGYDANNQAFNNVIKSVYNVTYSSGLNGGFLNGFFTRKISDTKGFQDVLADMQSENVYRVSSGQQRLTNSELSQATILRYIIAYAAEPEYSQKGSLHILELEPCASYTLRLETTGDEQKVTKLYKNLATNAAGEVTSDKELIEFKAGDVSLTQMTTSEFVGKVEDINAHYDMVYIGSSIGPYKYDGKVIKMNQQEKADGTIETAYNDKDMNGLIYSNVGDTYTTAGIQRHSVPQTGKVEEVMRFSGNDITEEKMVALQNFINAGFPVVVADNLVYEDTSAQVTEYEKKPLLVNETTVDNSSFMYEFLAANGNRENMFRLSDVSSSLLNMYLNVGRPMLTLQPGITLDATKSAQPLAADSNGNYRAYFEFKVDSVGISAEDVTYDFDLFIDINADGKFSRTTEAITQISVDDAAGNAVATDEYGRYMMRPGESYIATYILSASQRGVLPWKIQITENDGTGLRRADAIGYYDIYDKNKPEKIDVLQISTNIWRHSFEDPDNTGRTLSESNLADCEKIDQILLDLDDAVITGYDDNRVPYVQDGDYGHNWNMEKTMQKDPVTGEYKTIFGKYLCDRSKVPFDVTIWTLPCDWISLGHKSYLEHKLGAEKALKDVNNDNRLDAEEYLAFFRNFDMLVIGFGDAYRDPQDDELMKAIKYYVEEGRSILFTHDNTSPYTYPSSSTYDYDDHGYRFDRYLRDCFALNRYRCYKDGDLLAAAQNSTFQPEVAYKPRSGRSETVEEDQGITYSALQLYVRNNNEKRYLDGGDGMTNAWFNYYWTDDRVNKAPNIYRYNERWETYEVESVNNGQITRYPYVLPEKFSVAKTHGQWLQLDFTRDDDQDGESDLVVWYTLGGTDLYGMSPHDVRNNYYIYNMGNVTYSGVGHRDVMLETKDGTPSMYEVQLFINTLIAAYQSGLHNPEVRIVENYNPQSRDVKSIYLSYDEQMKVLTNMDGVIDETEDIYFVVDSTSLVRTDTMRVHELTADLYMELPSAEGAETLNFKGGNYYGRCLNKSNDGSASDMKVYRQAVDGSEVEVGRNADGSYSVESGVVYKATIPISKLRYYSNGKTVFDDSTTEVPDDGSFSARNARSLIVVATEKLTNKYSNTSTETKAMASVQTMRVRVFDMD